MGGAKWPGEVHVVCRTRAVVSDPESCLNDQKDRYGVEAFFSMELHGPASPLPCSRCILSLLS